MPKYQDATLHLDGAKFFIPIEHDLKRSAAIVVVHDNSRSVKYACYLPTSSISQYLGHRLNPQDSLDIHIVAEIQETFSCFNKLPTEIRLMIWEYALPIRRILDPRKCGNYPTNSLTKVHCHLLKISRFGGFSATRERGRVEFNSNGWDNAKRKQVALGVCSEFRKVALMSRRRFFSGFSSRALPPVYFNPKMDVLHIQSYNCLQILTAFQDLEKRNVHKFLGGINSISVDHELWVDAAGTYDDDIASQFLATLEYLTGVEEVIVHFPADKDERFYSGLAPDIDYVVETKIWLLNYQITLRKLKETHPLARKVLKIENVKMMRDWKIYEQEQTTPENEFQFQKSLGYPEEMIWV